MIKKILICDDQELVREVLSRFLTNKGFEVYATSNPETCLERAEKEIFDAAILDVNMPLMDGPFLMKKLKNRTKDMQFILMSGQISEESLRNQDLPAFLFFKKPFSLRSIFENLQGMLSKSGSRILVADDQDLLRELLSDYLKQKGFDVREARNGQEAIDLARQHRFDGIFMDVRMPEVGGILALKKMQEDGVRTPVILMSGFGDVSSDAEAHELGAHKFLSKPFRLETASGLLQQLD